MSAELWMITFIINSDVDTGNFKQFFNSDLNARREILSKFTVVNGGTFSFEMFLRLWILNEKRQKLFKYLIYIFHFIQNSFNTLK